ncbi:PLMN-like protein, partial [Mya arenaria]
DYPHSHSYHGDNKFPTDGSELAADNLCRDPSNSSFLWCYTIDPNTRWEKCDVPYCYASQTYQWVSGVISFSSQLSNPGNGANQVIGEADVYPAYKQSNLSWAPSYAHIYGSQYIEVIYPTQVHVARLEIYETFHGGAVSNIICFHFGGAPRIIWQDSTIQNIEEARIFSPTLTGYCFSNQIRLEFTSNLHQYQIDAIVLRGYPLGS